MPGSTEPFPSPGEVPGSAAGGEAVLEARDLVRDFGPVRAVDGISLSLREGELLTLFGPNGAGKTTLVGMLGGGLRPTEGRVRVRGSPLKVADPARHERIGVLSHRTFLYADLTVAENLRFYGRLFDLRDLETRIPERLERLGLGDRAGTFVGRLSRGLRQRVSLARCLLHDPEIVLLDEPYTGLDPHAAAVLREVLGELKDGRRTVVLVTHNLTQGLELADRVAVLVRGRLAYLEARDGADAVAFEARYRRIVESAG